MKATGQHKGQRSRDTHDGPERRPAILVVGVGNVLLRDEGVGLHVLAELARRYRFGPHTELLDGGTSGIELLRHVTGRELCLFIDAMQSGAPPGTVTVFRDQQVGARLSSRISPHQLGLSDLLAAALLTGETPKRVVLVGIEPAVLDPGVDLSPPVARAVPEAMRRVIAELAAHGAQAQPRTEPLAEGPRFFWRNEREPQGHTTVQATG